LELHVLRPTAEPLEWTVSAAVWNMGRFQTAK
jgi:hypothetical protein